MSWLKSHKVEEVRVVCASLLLVNLIKFIIIVYASVRLIYISDFINKTVKTIDNLKKIPVIGN